MKLNAISWGAALLLAAAVGSASQRQRSFDAHWRFLRADAPGAQQPQFNDSDWRVLDLPHDWSIEDLPPVTPADHAGAFKPVGPFSPQSAGGPATGHVVGGTGWYRKHFTLPAADTGKRVSIRFDGVYMDADTWINGHHLGNHPYGYTAFSYDLTPYLAPAGQENVLAVRVQNLGKNSRWYSGSGIYRHVWLTVTDPIHVRLWGLYVTTPAVSRQRATVNVATTITNASPTEATVTVSTRLLSPDDEAVATGETQTRVAAGGQSEVEQSFNVATPALWSLSDPRLYRAQVTLLRGGKTVDRTATHFGIRSIHFDAEHGFTLNGQPIKLKGGCMHHANGPLGSAAIDRAEARRVELMKANGFNAIRTSHNPPSPAFLDACDRQGMLVMDEAFDCWERGKNPQDYHLYFKQWWRRDLAAMVLRDRNHPSVILWSIGNEIPERGDPSGVAAAKKLVADVHRMDPTRPVTEAVCGFGGGRKWSEASAPMFALLGVCGYNYEWRHYASDHRLFPHRIMVGTESFPKEAFENWQAVEHDPWVIGDFVWTGMDYLGESGIGHTSLDNEKHTFLKPWPWFDSYCGDIDICGFKKPQSYYRDVVWGRSRLEMEVHAPIPPGRHEVVSGWGWPNERQSWTWPGEEGWPLQVHVYSSCNEVRLKLNGKVIGEQPVSAQSQLTATFAVPYTPGVLEAEGLVHGQVIASRLLRTAGPPRRIRLTVDRHRIHASRNDLAYVTVEVVDRNGERVPNATVPVHFVVHGAGELAAVGSGNPSDAESFRQPLRKTFHGRCLAILRPQGGAGEITLRAEATGLFPAELKVETY